MSKTYIIAFFLFSSFIARAQKSTEIGIFIGSSIYQGDFTEDLVEFEQIYLAQGIFGRFNVLNRLSIKAAYTHSKFAGSDIYSRTRRSRGMIFEGDVNEFAMTAEIWAFNQFKEQNSIFNPYIFIGTAFSRVDSRVTLYWEEKPFVADPSNRNNFVVMPFGFGMRGNLSPNLRLGLEVGFRATFSDYIDNFSPNSEKVSNDWYTFLGGNFSWNFIQKKVYNTKSKYLSNYVLFY